MEHLYKLLICSFFLSFYSHFLIAEEEAEDLCASKTAEQSLVDNTYNYLNTKFCQPALWFDDFFADERTTSDSRAGTMVRWYNDFIWQEGEGFSFVPNLNARLYLPKITKKLKLVFESENDDNEDRFFPDSDSDQPKNALGLSYDVSVKDRSSFIIKATIRPSIEGRFRYIYPLNSDTLWRFTQTIYQKENVTGEATHIDFDHSLNEKFLFRWANFSKLETDLDGFEFGSGFTLYHYISPTQALSYRANFTANNKPYYYINNTQLGVTYRHNILRNWFFYELIPEVNWPKEEYQERRKEVTFTLRLEVMFKNI
ncbi:MAG: hypothetical protein WBM99_03255 [Psychromonas sp.]